MHEATYYRGHAERARRMAAAIGDSEAREMLLRIAGDYDDIAADLDRGLIEINDSERWFQRG